MLSISKSVSPNGKVGTVSVLQVSVSPRADLSIGWTTVLWSSLSVNLWEYTDL